MSEEQETRQPARAVVGHCPDCYAVVIVENNYESWPLVRCRCGWTGATTDVLDVRYYERGTVTR